MIRGTTALIAHIGYPTESFKAPMIYNPYFEQQGIDAVVMPMGVKADDYPQFLASLRKVTNLRGALITMPHKVTTVDLVDEVTADGPDRRRVQRDPRAPDGSLLGDMFDGAGFVRGVSAKACASRARARSSSAAAVWGRRSRHRSRRPGSRRWESTTRLRARPKALPTGCGDIIPPSRCGQARTIPPAMRWSSTQRRSA
jgi:hypothetical protein